jgi:hypothetical protein
VGILIYPCPSVRLSGYRYMICPAISSYSFETMFGSSLSPVVCEGLMTYLRYLCLLAYTVVFNTYCVMLFVLLVSVLCLVYPMLPVSLDCICSENTAYCYHIILNLHCKLFMKIWGQKANRQNWCTVRILNLIFAD